MTQEHEIEIPEPIRIGLQAQLSKLNSRPGGGWTMSDVRAAWDAQCPRGSYLAICAGTGLTFTARGINAPRLFMIEPQHGALPGNMVLVSYGYMCLRNAHHIPGPEGYKYVANWMRSAANWAEITPELWHGFGHEADELEPEAFDPED